MNDLIWDLKAFGDRDALIADSGETMTYEELDAAGERIYEKIGERCLVFQFCTNTIGSVTGYTAFLNHGVVPVLLNAHLDEDLRRELLSVYRPAYLWAPEEMAESFKGFAAVHADHGYVLLRAEKIKPCELGPDLTLLLTTSGSTGSPKFVRQSRKNILSNTASIVEYLELKEDERPITTLPMNYTYGLSIITTHLMVGAAILLTDKAIVQREFWEFFEKGQATSFGGVPYTYEMLQRLRFFRMDLPSLRYMTQAGGKLTADLHQRFAEDSASKGRKFIVMYGQCEATARMGYLPAQHALEKVGSMGIPVPGGRFELIDEKGEEVTEPDTTGELVYYGDNVTLGYAECREDLAKGDERKGRLETGDMARFDADGFYYIVGRKKRFLKIFGNRVNLDEIDRMVKMQFDDMDCASAGVDDALYIFVTDESVVSDVENYVADKTGFAARAINVVVLPQIPKNDSGKVLYKELAKYYS